MKKILLGGCMTKRLTLSASSLTGDNIENLAGESLGHVKELMIDVITGKVAYVVVSFGGFLGMGDKLFAIPFSKFKVDETKKIFVLDVEKDLLKSTPGFDKNNWPDFSSDTWSDEIHKYYSVDL